jgi:hypothetical protein
MLQIREKISLEIKNFQFQTIFLSCQTTTFYALVVLFDVFGVFEIIDAQSIILTIMLHITPTI